VIAPIQGKPIDVTPVTPTPSPKNESVNSSQIPGVVGGLVVNPGQHSATKITVTGLPREFHSGQVIEGNLLCPKFADGGLQTGCVVMASEELKKHSLARATLLGPPVESQCPAGFRSDGDVCVKPIPNGSGGLSANRPFKGDGQCPSGWEDLGESCQKPETKGNCAHYKPGPGFRAAFWDQRNGGQCWTCPALLHRNPTLNSIDAADACTAGNDEGIVWQSAQFPDPGVAAFITPEIVQVAFADAAYVDAFLTKRAKGLDLTKQNIWQQMTDSPNDSPEFKALIFTAILAAAEADIQDERTRNAIQIFESYIKQRRAYIGRDAINMYNNYCDLNSYKRNLAVNVPAGAPPSGAMGIAPEDYLSAAYGAAIPDSRGEKFMKALVDLGGTAYEPSSSKDGDGRKVAAAALAAGLIPAIEKINSVLKFSKILEGKAFGGAALGLEIAASALEVAEGAMTMTEQDEAEKKYNELNDEISQDVHLEEILKSGSAEEKNRLVLWWALATSSYGASDTVGQFPRKNADVCATYPSQCADIKRVVAQAHANANPVLAPVKLAPAPAAFVEEVNATTALAKLLATVNSAATSTAVNSTVIAAVQRVNQAALAVKKFNAADTAAAYQHKSELDSASIQVRNQLTRIKGVSGAYPILQNALAPLPAALRGGPATSD
jgi:hypothetical protein